MGFADLHIHSVHSHDGTCSIPAILKQAAEQTDLDVIAITDHDSVSGLREAMTLAPLYGIEVIPGCEISTAQGHLLAFFITEPVPAGLSLAETVKIVGSMGGLCAIPHPDAPLISGARSGLVRAVLADPEVARVLVGIETFNSGLFFSASNRLAEDLGRSLGLACLGSSDSHILATIGDGRTEFAGRSAADLRYALEQHATMAHSTNGMPGTAALRRWFPHFCLRKLGWVASNDGPQTPNRYMRMPQTIAGR